MKSLARIALVAAVSYATVEGLAQTLEPVAVFSGSVVDGVTGQPVSGARVRIAAGRSAPPDFDVRNPQFSASSSPVAGGEATVEIDLTSAVRTRAATDGDARPAGRAIYAALTDLLGRFEFRDFDPGVYTLAVDASGYVYQVYGQTSPFGAVTPLSLPDRNARLTIRMIPTASLAGSVTDTDERPVPDLPVYLLRAEFTDAGERVFRVETETVTDAEGRYTLTNVPAGRYYVAAGRSGLTPGPQRGLPPYRWTYYPGVSEAALAGSVDLLAGTRVDGIDLVAALAEVRTVQGRVVDYRTGEAPPSLTVRLVGRLPFNKAGTSVVETTSGRYDAESGTFEFVGVPEGRYRLDAILPRASNPEGRVQVLVDPFAAVSDAHVLLEVGDSDVEEVALEVPPRGLLRGQVKVVGDQPVPSGAFGPLQLGLQGSDYLQPAIARVSVGPGAEAFGITGSFFGRYQVFMAGLPEDYFVSEIRLNGTRVSNDIVDIPRNTASELSVLLDPNGGEIQGTVVDEEGQPLGGLAGLLLPDPLPGSAIGKYQEVSVNSEGHFALRGIPPGAWRLYVWSGVDRFEFFDPDVLRRSVADAIPLRIDERSRISIQIEAIRLP